MGIGLSYYNHMLEQRAAQDRKDEAFRADPSKLDSVVASITAKISPSGQKPKMSEFQNKTDAYDSLVKPDHPFAGFGNEMKERMSTILAHPASKGVNPVELADALATKMINEPGKSGVSRITEANEFKRRQDARWFGIPGEDTSLKKPLGSQYDTWLAERRKQETPEGMAVAYRASGNEEGAKRVLEDDSGVASPGGLALNIGLGATVGAAFGGGLPGAAIGAVTGGISEVLGKPISKAVTRSEWYNSLAGPLTSSRSETGVGSILKAAVPAGIAGILKGGGPTSLKGLITGGVAAAAAGYGVTDTGKAFIAEVAPYVAIGGALDKVAFKALLVPKAAGKSIAANPSAKNVVESGDAVAESTKVMSDDSFIGRFVNKIVNAGDMKLGINEDFVQGLRNVVRKANGQDAASKAVLKRLSEESGRHAQIVAANQADFRGLRQARELDRAAEISTPEEYAGWIQRKVKGFDEIAHEEAIRHPDGYVAGVPEAYARQRARNLFSNNPASDTVESGLELENAALNKKSKKSEAVVNRVLNETTFSPQNYESDIYAHVASLGIEDATGAAKNVKTVVSPKVQLVNNIAKIDADPVLTKVIEVTSAPTELGRIAADAGLAVSAPGRKLAAKLQGTKDRFAAMQEEKKLASMAPDEQLDYLKDKLYDNPINQERWKSLLAKRQNKMTPEEIAKDNEELSYHGGGANAEAETSGEFTYLGSQKIKASSSEGRTKVKSTTGKSLEDASADDLAGKGELKVATDTEALAKPVDVIRRRNGKAPVIDAEAVRAETSAAEETAFNEARSIQSLTPDQAHQSIMDSYGQYKTGKVPPEVALEKINRVAEIYTDPKVLDKNFASEDSVGTWLGMSDSLVTELRAAIASKAVLATGAGAAFLSFFLGGKEAEAGGLSEALVKGLSTAKNIPKATIEFMEAAKAARYSVPVIEEADKFLLAVPEFQVGLKGGAANILSNFEQWSSKAGKKGIRHAVMSPDKVLDEVTGTGTGLMSNVAPFKASFQAAEYKNITNAAKVVNNIATDAGIVSARSEVKEAFSPLNEKMARQIEFDWRTQKVEDLTKKVEKIKLNKARHNQDVVDDWAAKTQSDLDVHAEKLKGLEGAVKDFHTSWESVAEQAAKEHSAVRTFLALGDNAEFEKYPFLKNIPFSTDEKVAVGRMREQMLQYKERLKEIGEPVIEGPYAHHVLHPDLDTKQFINMMGGQEKAAAYLRTYRRSFNSRPLMPDFESSMQHYVMDTERRIQQISFWKKEGWDAVLEESKGIPVIHDALNALKRNVAPVDGSFSNKLLQKYQEFESVMRLFLSPSATLKHFIKETGDLAQRGAGETVEAYPLATKMTGIRLAEANPMIRKSLSKLGFTAKNDQDRLMQEYFKSIVPVQGTRRMLLDVGLTQQDQLFKKADGLWGKIQDVGSMGINFAELSGRGLSTVLGMQMAAKKGMTIEQGLYGTYDMILKNNFLSREFNPTWLQHPGVKAAFMFQGTPFKIMERRVVNFVRSGRVVKDVGEAIYNATKADYKNGNFLESSKILKQLRDIRSLVKEGEHRVTSNIFLDAALKETDFFGTPVISQMAKDIFIVGAATYGGAEAGVNLYHHLFHIPFMKAMATGSEPVLAVNPGLAAIYKGIDAWKKRDENDDEWVTTKILNKWLGGGFYGLIPDPIKKLHRISIDDIPDIYQKDPYKYLFAIPATKPSKRQ
jgi:hypothetical protein